MNNISIIKLSVITLHDHKDNTTEDIKPVLATLQPWKELTFN